MKENVLITDFFLTQILGTPVLDRMGEEVGTLSDAIIAPGETFPKITGFEVRTGKEAKILERREVHLVSPRIVTLVEIQSRLSFRAPSERDLFLVKDFLDKQIVDIHGAKVVRVNDLKLARFNGDFHLIAADVGFTGVLRRLKLMTAAHFLLERFGKKFSEHLISWSFVEPISGRNPKMKLVIPQSKLGELHPAELAEILHELSPPERAAMVESLDQETAAEALHDVEPTLSLEILDDLPPEKATSILKEMKPDDAADILAAVPQEKIHEVLSAISTKEAGEIKKLLAHRQNTAGGLMTPDLVRLSGEFTVEETIEHLRRLSPDTETIYYLYVVDEEDRLQGIVSLRHLIIAKPERRLKDIMTHKMVHVKSHTSKEEVAQKIAKYDLLALPVLDEASKLIGIVTVDDVLDLLLPPRRRRRVR